MILDLDDDGRKDLLSGNTNGQLVFYSNAGTGAAPIFDGYSLVESEGTAIDLAGTPRSRWRSQADQRHRVMIGAQ